MAGNIVKRGDGCYLVRVTLGYDEHGKRKVHTHTIHGTKKDAERYLGGVQREKDLGRFSESAKIKLDEYLNQWLQQAAKLKVRERTFGDYKEIVDKRIEPRLGGVALDKLTPLAVQTFYNELVESGLSAATVRKVHAVLHSALKQAVRWRMLQSNPTSDVELPRRVKHEMASLTDKQAAKFLEAARKDTRGIIYVVALATGMRPQEYLALKWSDIDLNTGTIRVQRTIFWPRSGGGWRFEETKTAGSRRTIILPKPTLPLLRSHRAKQNKLRSMLGSEWPTHDLVFTNELGGALHQDNINKRHFKEILKAAKLPKTLRPYDLRHSCASLLLERGENLKVVSERLGHASITLTGDTYMHVTPTMQQGAAKRMEDIFKPKPKSRASSNGRR